jgi:PTH2 family peptidyl-tRNA hydrolase
MYKQIIIIRSDLGMGKGKSTSQALHAALGSIKLVDRKIVQKWEDEGAKKVVLKAKDLNELENIENKLKREKIPHFIVRDAGLTQIKKGTITALGIGPIEERKIDNITGMLKLL